MKKELEMHLEQRFRAQGAALDLTKCKIRREQYGEAYLPACFDFYEELIRSDPDVLRRYFRSMDERI